MGAVRVYIKPFDDAGDYVSDWTEVSRYVTKVGAIKVDVDSADFQLGFFRTSSVSLSLNNRDGRFSDVGSSESIFHYTRANSLVKITWAVMPEQPKWGFARAGFCTVSPEVTVFEGLLNDDGFREDANTEVVDFRVLGYDSLFDGENVPFDDISAGDSIQDLIYACLNQTSITNHLTVSLANISPGEDQNSDVVAWLENRSVKEALDKLLLVSNSVAYIENGVIYVTDRTPSVSVVKTFYGQASRSGIENIVNIFNVTNGINRTFNYFYWRDSAAVQKNNAAIQKYKVRKKEIDFEIFTNVTKQGTLLENLLNEFYLPKKEFEISVPVEYDVLELALLDKIAVDYPTVFVPTPGFSLPMCGIAVCGSTSTDVDGATLPLGLWSLTIDVSGEWKILSKEIDLMAEKATFKVRAV